MHCSANILRLEVWWTQVDRKSKSKAKLRKCFYSCYWRAQWPWSIVSLTYKIMKETICGQDLARWEHTASAHSASVASPISGCLSCLSSSPLSSHIPQGTWRQHLHFHTTGAPFYDLPSVPPTHPSSQEHGAAKVLFEVKHWTLLVVMMEALSPSEYWYVFFSSYNHLLAQRFISYFHTPKKKTLKWPPEICFVYYRIQLFFYFYYYFYSERVAGFPCSYMQGPTTWHLRGAQASVYLLLPLLFGVTFWLWGGLTAKCSLPFYLCAHVDHIPFPIW